MTVMTQAQQDAFLQEVVLAAQARRDDYRLVIRGQEYSTFDLERMAAKGETALLPADVQASIKMFLKSMAAPANERPYICYGSPKDTDWSIEITGGSGQALKCYLAGLDGHGNGGANPDMWTEE